MSKTLENSCPSAAKEDIYCETLIRCPGSHDADGMVREASCHDESDGPWQEPRRTISSGCVRETSHNLMRTKIRSPLSSWLQALDPRHVTHSDPPGNTPTNREEERGRRSYSKRGEGERFCLFASRPPVAGRSPFRP